MTTHEGQTQQQSVKFKIIYGFFPSHQNWSKNNPERDYENVSHILFGSSFSKRHSDVLTEKLLEHISLPIFISEIRRSNNAEIFLDIFKRII